MDIIFVMFIDLEGHIVSQCILIPKQQNFVARIINSILFFIPVFLLCDVPLLAFKMNFDQGHSVVWTVVWPPLNYAKKE